jgi:fibronectin-binding autotransporter adhesin
MRRTDLPLLTVVLLALLAGGTAFGATVIVSDNYNVTTTTTGFALDNGVNYGINPPTTRLTGTAAANLRYYQTATARAGTFYGINSNKLRVQQDNTIGRFTLSANGSTPFNFSSVLGSLVATPANPAVYDVTIGMQNNATATSRFSFAIGTAEGDANSWDFGIQMYRAVANDNFYTIQKRVDTASSGQGSDLNAVMTVLPANSGGSLTNFLIRVTDAGAESGSDYHSRIQVSTNNGASFFYDTASDPALPLGFRFDGPGRYFLWDQAGNTSGNVFYENFSVTWLSGPTTVARTWTGGGADGNWSNGANWDGAAPVAGNLLVFDGTTRQSNTNDITDLWVPALTINNGGFALYGLGWTNIGAITNLGGVNTLRGDLYWGLTDLKTWNVAAGSELVLDNNTSVEVNGDHYIFGGGTVRLKGNMSIGQATTANPAFTVNEGLHLIDGGTFTSRGGYRIGSLATAATGARTILTNGAALSITASAGNIRVGDSANPVTARLIIDHSTVTSAGARLCIPYAAGATSEVVQVGGTVSGARVSFSDNGAGTGTYAITNGTLETYSISEGVSGALSYMYFDNAVLRAAYGATNNFMSGLNRAEIVAGDLTLDAQADIVIAQKLIGVGGLIKTGTGTATLTGANTYAGNNTVNQGRLVLPTGATYAAPVTVADDAALGALVTAPGTSLTNGSVTLGTSGNTAIYFDLATSPNPTAPLMRVTNLTTHGAVTIHVANGLTLTQGTFVLIDYSGSIGGGGYSAFVLGNLPSGVDAELVNNTANSSVDLHIKGVQGFRWTGANNTSWNYSEQNWINQQNGSPSTYTDGYQAEFRDGATRGTVDLEIYPGPSAIVVSNSALPYVWNNAAITVPIMIKDGTGSLTRIGGEADAIAALELDAGSYIVSNFYDATFATLLTDASAGNGTFVKDGPNTLTVTSSNVTYDGTVRIQQGTLKVGSDRALGATTGVTIITNGATLDLNHFTPGFEPIIVSGAGVNGDGAILDTTTSGAVTTALRDVTLAGHTTFGAPNGGRWDLRVRNSTGPGPGLKGNSFNLTKVGSGLVSIACQRNLDADTPYWQMNLGNILVSAGTLAFAESLNLGNPGASLTVNPGAILQLYDLGHTNPVARTITMIDARINASGTSTDTNIVNGGFQLTGANTFWSDQAHLIVNGPMGGSGSLSFFATDPGMLILNGNNTYPGNTTVTNGTFGGYGTLAGNLIMLGGTNAPGWPGVGTLTVNGAVTLAGNTLMELNRSLSPNSDRIAVGGVLTFGGVLKVVLAAGAPSPQAGDVYQLFNKGSGAAFSSISLPSLAALPGNLAWDTTKLAVNGSISVSGSPTISTISADGGVFAFSGTGGSQGSTYYVVMSTNAATALVSWQPVATNTFGPGGSFSYSTNIVGGVPKAFYRLLAP